MSISLKEKLFKGPPFIVERARGSNALKAGYTEEDKLYVSIDQARYDYASYNLLAARARYSYLLKLAKEKNLSL